jgi:putative glutamine amidotransferase
MSDDTRPLIGLSGRRKTGADIAGFPDSLAGLAIDLYLADYARRVLDAGGLPVHLPMDAEPAHYLPHLDGLLLSGGADLDPSTYGAEPDGNGDYEPERDRLELALLAGARDRGLPVLGICRGLQLVNVAAGGTLHQHVPVHARYDVGPDRRVHPVRFEPETILGALYVGRDGRSGRPVTVNSLHHQTVDRVGHDLRVAARSDDGTVEGLETPDGLVVAVQWHPEMLPATEPVFGWLVQRAGGRVDRG